MSKLKNVKNRVFLQWLLGNRLKYKNPIELFNAHLKKKNRKINMKIHYLLKFCSEISKLQIKIFVVMICICQAQPHLELFACTCPTLAILDKSAGLPLFTCRFENYDYSAIRTLVCIVSLEKRRLQGYALSSQQATQKKGI